MKPYPELEIIPRIISWLKKQTLDETTLNDFVSRLTSSNIVLQYSSIYEICIFKLLRDHALDARFNEKVESTTKARDIVLYHNNKIIAIVEVVAMYDSNRHHNMFRLGETLRERAREAGLTGVIFEIEEEGIINKIKRGVFPFIQSRFDIGENEVNLQKEFGLPVTAKRNKYNFPPQISYPVNLMDCKRLKDIIKDKTRQHKDINVKYPFIIAVCQESHYNLNFDNLLKVLESVSEKVSGFLYLYRQQMKDKSIIFNRINYLNNPFAERIIDHSLFKFVPCAIINKEHKEFLDEEWTEEPTRQFNIEFND